MSDNKLKTVRKKRASNATTKKPVKIKKVAAKKAKTVRKSKVEKTRNGKTMTEAQFFSKLRSGLRNAFRWWVPMQKALKAASRPSQSTNRRLKTEYHCAHCQNWFPRTQVEIDHIVECGSLKSYDDIVPFIERLTAEDIESYQILCKPCHRSKTDDYKITKLKIA